MKPIRSFLLCAAVLVAYLPHAAHAVPSYARELKVPCAACHTAFPQLTAFGRQFKLDGYMLGGEPAGTEPNAPRLCGKSITSRVTP